MTTTTTTISMMKTFIIIILIILANVALSVWCVPMKRPMPEEPECPKDWCTCKKRTSMYVTPCLIVNCNTSLNSIQDVNDYLQKLPNQTCKLSISKNQLPPFSATALQKLERLHEIVIENCLITNLNDIFAEVSGKIKSAIRVLGLLSNEIENTTGQPFLGFFNVHSLNLKNNSITTLGRHYFSDLSNLEYLNLAYNKIKVLDSHTFQNLTKLEQLILDRNQIQDIHPEAFFGLNALQQLAISHNSIKSIEPGTLMLPNLTKLTMENNLLRILTASVIEGPMLKHVYLERNNIREIHPKAISRFRSIAYCYVNNNMLRSIPDEALQKFKNVSYVDFVGMLRHNPWHCGCQMMKLVLTLKQLYQKDNNLLEFRANNDSKMQCESPEHVKRKSLGQLSWNDLSCENTSLPSDVCHVEMNSSTNEDSCMSLQRKLCPSAMHASCICSTQEVNCYVCPSGFYGEHHKDSHKCSACPVLTSGGYGARNPSECQCMEGFQYVNNSCEECPLNTSKKEPGNHLCQSCLFNTYTLYSASTNCECEFDYLTYDESSGRCIQKLVYNTSSETEDAETEEDSTLLISIATSSILATTGILTAILYYYVVKNRIMNGQKKEVKLVMNSILQNMSQSRACENNYIINDVYSGLIVELHQIKFEKLLGQGAFGQVHKVIVTELKGQSEPTTAAVKTLRANHNLEEKDALYMELQQLLYVGHHPNIINLLGFVSTDDALMIVLEYAAYGDLLSHLKGKMMITQYAQLQFQNQSSTTFNDNSNAIVENASTSSYMRPTVPSEDDGGTETPSQTPEVGNNMIDIKTLLSIAWQVAKGMNHLAQMKCIHRDLAARNVLLSTGMVAKVSDFGLARAVYESGYYFKETKGRLPFKWMPPEAILEGQYTTKSDVWSYGILLWEICTLGGNPYPGIPINSLLDLLKSGYRMVRPNNCPVDVYELMRNCWRERPSDRPSFGDLSNSLDKILQKAANSEYMEVHDDTKNEFVISDDQNTENVVPYDYLVKDSPQELPHDTSQHFTNFCQNSELDRLLPIPNTVNDNRG